MNDNSKKTIVQEKDFSISENTPNICFLRDVSGFIDSKTKNHIKKWKNYKDGSNDISNLYRDLEYDHAFVQWIFPNFFKSMFNPRSSRLTLEERNEIIAN